MEAIFRDGSRQFKVEEGATVNVDYRDVEPGTTLEFSDVLYVGGPGASPKIGTPNVEGARVVGKVLGMIKGKKVIVTQFRRRKNSKTRNGHRQKYTQVQIEKVEA